MLTIWTVFIPLCHMSSLFGKASIQSFVVRAVKGENTQMATHWGRIFLSSFTLLSKGTPYLPQELFQFDIYSGFDKDHHSSGVLEDQGLSSDLRWTFVELPSPENRLSVKPTHSIPLHSSPWMITGRKYDKGNRNSPELFKGPNNIFNRNEFHC